MIERLSRLSLKQIEQRLSETEVGEQSAPLLLQELAELHRDWIYPKGLEHRAGYLYADLCEKLGALLLAADRPAEALAVWRECPWPSVVPQEKRALARVLQAKVDQRSLVLSPPVSVVLAQGRTTLGELVNALEQETTDLVLTASGRSYLFSGSLARPQGISRFQAETDGSTLFYVAVMVPEVESRLRTARSYFQMGDPIQTASWLLRAAHAAHQTESFDLAVSLLTKAAQLAPASEPVRRSLSALAQAGHAETLYSRVAVERQLMQPTPRRRSARRPEALPGSEAESRDAMADKLRSSKGDLERRGVKYAPEDGALIPSAEGSEGGLQALVAEWSDQELTEKRAHGPALVLLTPECRAALDLNYASFEERYHQALALGAEGGRRWNRSLRAALESLLQEWSEGDSRGLDGLPNDLLGEERWVPFYLGIKESWQIPLLWDSGRLNLPSIELSAWLRHFSRRFGARLVALSLDGALLYLPVLPELPLERSRFLADLLKISSDLEETFDPNHLHRLGEGYLLSLPLGGFPEEEGEGSR